MAELIESKLVIVVDLHRGGLKNIDAFLDSCFSQPYKNWVLFLCDNLGNRGAADYYLKGLELRDDRIRFYDYSKYGGFLDGSEALVDSLEGDFLLLLEDLKSIPADLFTDFVEGEKGNMADGLLNVGGFRFRDIGCLRKHGGLHKALDSGHQLDDIKLISFYFPQYHLFPENDLFWGKGFSEWTNTSRAKAIFDGHYQPHLPADLGYYDIRVHQVIEEQAALARKYGVYGFCYYYYWFKGKRVMHEPINMMLKSGRPDFPFCLCWANENWTRRWDGSTQEVLIPQEHSVDDGEAFIRGLAPVFNDTRYIRIDGKPLFLVYRAGIIDNCKEMIGVWRDYCRSIGIGEIHLCAIQSFGLKDPMDLGFDAAVEFPPHHTNYPSIKGVYKFYNTDFKGEIYHYSDAVDEAMTKPKPDYQWFRGLMPAWDNSARKPNDAYIFHGSSPEEYGRWLRYLIDYSREHLPVQSRFVFVNAWNEWAEGCHLEPDQKNGLKYLEVTRELTKGFVI